MITKQFTRTALFLLLMLSAAACRKSTQEKIEDFISSYNRSAEFLSDPIIIRTFAAPISSDSEGHGHVKIIFVSKMDRNDPRLEAYSAMLPGIFNNLAKNNKIAAELINENVRFEIKLCAEDQTVLKKIVVDKKQMELLALKKPVKLNDSQPAGFRDILESLNQGLPAVINKEMGLTMLKVEVLDNNDLVYYLEIADSTASLFKNSNASALLKDEILRGPDSRGFLKRIKSIGLKDVRYVYSDKKGKRIDEIIITDKDL